MNAGVDYENALYERPEISDNGATQKKADFR